MEFIETVEDIFYITGRGCVIVPGIPYSFEPAIGNGAKLEFHNPSGSIVQGTVEGIEMVSRGKPARHAPFSLNRDIKKSEIEIGAKFYLTSCGPKA